MLGYKCDVCHRGILREPHGNDPGDHDPAYHVAQAYHRETQVGICMSCSQRWPCKTIKEYS